MSIPGFEVMPRASWDMFHGYILLFNMVKAIFFLMILPAISILRFSRTPVAISCFPTFF
jgi:hypothetical protein